ncbi:putative bifunctional diguanylate cyclase/phosphodiesterase [Devosia sp.]|uniref:putative bifunctional diguanylate cyclase/phosphodiesterase n=1 Tax=Devosia sp. TaxID=1871048 RepID=UPI003A90449C
MFAQFRTLTGKATLLLLVFVAAGILVVAGLAYYQLNAYTQENAQIRIDRAARAASEIASLTFDSDLTVERDAAGLPSALQLNVAQRPDEIADDATFDGLLADIGMTNQGAANLFVWNAETQAFDRFATTFRKPDGSMPPPMSIAAGHPAYASLAAGEVFKGNVPVMGRMRLAYLTPILSPAGSVAGILAIDVGFADDLVRARNELRSTLLWSTGLILVVVAALGAHLLRCNLQPLRELARFAHRLAEGQTANPVPFSERNDEVGQLALGLGRVVDLQHRLETLAYTDTVTGLGNRPQFLADLDRTVAAAGALSRGMTSAVLMLDLDHFKEVNDAHGHHAGDAILQAIGRRILAELPSGARAARIGGDEFAMVVDAIAPDKIHALCGRLLQVVAQPITIAEGQVHTQASIGVALIPQHADTAQDAYLHADLALRGAKADGRNRTTMYATHLLETAQQTMELASMLREAIGNGELSLHFQPQVRLHPQRVHGLEALARWQHPVHGFISPGTFIPVAETNGLIVELGKWVLNEVSRIGRQWLDEGLAFEWISVNVSAAQLWQPDFIETVIAALGRHEFPAERLCIEVTETLFAHDAKGRSVEVFNALRILGIRVSLDDFGSGYSSLSYLNRMPLDELKIDRSFVAKVDRDARKQQVLGGIVALGEGLGLSIIAEGAETREEVQFLARLGCDYVQGYYFSRPVPKDQVPLTIARIAASDADWSVADPAEGHIADKRRA